MFPQQRRPMARDAAVRNLNDAWNAAADALDQLSKAHQFFLYEYSYDEVRQNSVVSEAEDTLENAVFAASAVLEALDRVQRYA